jgi:hypothetical protein
MKPAPAGCPFLGGFFERKAGSWNGKGDRPIIDTSAVSAAAFTAVTLTYIARYDLGMSREEIRAFAVIAAGVGVALVGIEYFGKKLRKPN